MGLMGETVEMEGACIFGVIEICRHCHPFKEGSVSVRREEKMAGGRISMARGEETW